MTTLNVELYDALLAAGATDQKARAAATSVPPASAFATKADFAQLGTRLRRSIQIGCDVVVGLVLVDTFIILIAMPVY